jgi:hypothetical protein
VGFGGAHEGQLFLPITNVSSAADKEPWRHRVNRGNRAVTAGGAGAISASGGLGSVGCGTI